MFVCRNVRKKIRVGRSVFFFFFGPCVCESLLFSKSKKQNKTKQNKPKTKQNKTHSNFNIHAFHIFMFTHIFHYPKVLRKKQNIKKTTKQKQKQNKTKQKQKRKKKNSTGAKNKLVGRKIFFFFEKLKKKERKQNKTKVGRVFRGVGRVNGKQTIFMPNSWYFCCTSSYNDYDIIL